MAIPHGGMYEGEFMEQDENINPELRKSKVGGNMAKTKEETVDKNLPVPHKTQPAPILQNYQQLKAIASDMFKSGLFPHIKNAVQAVAVIEYGREMNVPPMQALNTMFPINGKIGIEAKQLMAIAKTYGCRYKIVKDSDEEVKIEFREACGEIHPVSFTFEEAKKMNVVYQRDGKTLKKAWAGQCANMLLQRCVTKAIRRFASEVFMGGSVYTIEELTSGDATTVEEASEIEPLTIIDKPEEGAEYEIISDGIPSEVPEAPKDKPLVLTAGELLAKLQKRTGIVEDLNDYFITTEIDDMVELKIQTKTIKAEIVKRKARLQYLPEPDAGCEINPEVMHWIRWVERRSDNDEKVPENLFEWKDFEKQVLQNAIWGSASSKNKVVVIKDYIKNHGGKV